MARPFLRKLRRYWATIPALAFGFVASPAFSTTVTVDASNITSGKSSASFTGATLKTSGGKFTNATSGGIGPTPYIGINGGSVRNELDGSQRLTFSFTGTGAVINEITLGMLFLAGQAGDVANEAAQLKTSGGPCTGGAVAACILSATGVFKGSAVNVTNLSPATGGNGGIFKIVNPFGTDMISQLQLSPWLISGRGAANSDFGLIGITYTTTAIPEPASLALVGLGVIGLAVAGRRRTRR
jgi:hypothetical protein